MLRTSCCQKGSRQSEWPDWASFCLFGDCLLWAFFLKISEIAHIIGQLFSSVKVVFRIGSKMDLARFWANFSLTHLVTLPPAPCRRFVDVLWSVFCKFSHFYDSTTGFFAAAVFSWWRLSSFSVCQNLYYVHTHILWSHSSPFAILRSVNSHDTNRFGCVMVCRHYEKHVPFYIVPILRFDH
jgi:hypothetical protein